MPKINPHKDKDKKSKVIKLHEEGLTLREIGAVVNKSYEWVRGVIHKVDLTNDDKGVW